MIKLPISALPLPVTNQRGFSMVEIIVILVILSLLSVVGLTNLSATRQKQSVINTAHQLQAALDTARSQSVAQTPDLSGQPATWSVLIDHHSSPPTFSTGPFGDLSSFDASPSPPGAKTQTIVNPIKISTSVPGNQRVAVVFEKLSGKPVIKKVNPSNGKLVSGYTYNLGTPFEIKIQTSYGQQSVFINREGITYLGKFK